MSRIIAAINMTLDGNYDHTAGIADAALHQHYTALLGQASAILYGRTTYQLMEYWRTVRENPSEEPSMNAFAAAIDTLPKIVFSRTLQTVDWETATLAQGNLIEAVLRLRAQQGNDILVGSRSLILQLMQHDLIDEYQLCIHPVVAGSGPHLLEGMHRRMALQLLKTKSFDSGAVILYYAPKREGTAPLDVVTA